MKRSVWCLLFVLTSTAQAKAECLTCESEHSHAANVASAALGTAEATYCLGDLWVSANDVNTWNFISDGLFRDDLADYVQNHTELPTSQFPVALFSANRNVLGEATFGEGFVYEDVYVGNLQNILANPPGTHRELQDLLLSDAIRFEYASFTHGGGAGEITICPEPSVGLLCVIAAVGCGAWRWRRRGACG